jgi:transcriptional regulator with XRE-family HTH domain
MPRKPKAANLEHPLRKLRQQFDVTQDKLGELIGMQGTDIRNIENQKMKLSSRIFRRILNLLGAEYSTNRKLWLLTGTRKRASKETLFAWRRASEPGSELKRNDQNSLSYRIAALLNYVKPSEYHVVYTKISEALEDILEEHPNPETQKAFKASAPSVKISRALGESLDETGVLKDDEAVSVAEELGIPTIVLPNSKLLEITRIYEEIPKSPLT